MKRASFLLALCCFACGGDGDDDEQNFDALAEAFNALPGVQVVQIDETADSGVRVILSIEQLSDHDDPSSPTFSHNVVVFHVDPASPVVVNTEGYSVGTGYSLSEPTSILDANEVQIEHRYFGTSAPETIDWSTLDIAQAAADNHHIVETLKGFYSGLWVSTGASKGGVGALTYRRFYPDDVVGTVAYVAPHATSLRDERYLSYVASRGDNDCRDALAAFQIAALSEPRRTDLATNLSSTLTEAGYGSSTLGADRILELTTRETPFVFWQYASSDYCSSIPDVDDSTDDEVLGFIDDINALVLWTDEGIAGDQAYWLSSATQQGYPADKISHLGDRVLYAELPTPQQMVTVVENPVYDGTAAQDVYDWVATSASRVVLVYGENDPWTAGAFTVSGANDTSSHTVESGNHYASLSELPSDESDAIVARIRAWAGQ